MARPFALSPCSQTLLALIVLNGDLNPEQIRQLIVPLATDLAIGGGEWIDHLQTLLSHRFVIRVPSVDGYVYRATDIGEYYYGAFLKDATPGAAAS